MPTDIVMPQMGESIFEGTITKWLKKPGDKVQRDEPLFEISTDKVDAEIPAPATGTLQEVKVAEGTTVQVNTVVGTIAADGEAVSAPAKSVPAAPLAAEKKEAAPAKPAAASQPLHPPRQTETKKITPALHRWSEKSPATTMSISRKFPAVGWVDASPSKTSLHSSRRANPRPLLLHRQRRSRLRRKQPRLRRPSPATWYR